MADLRPYLSQRSKLPPAPPDPAPNQNPALANILKILGERYLSPVPNAQVIRPELVFRTRRFVEP